MRTDENRKNPRLCAITGALIGAAFGGALTDSFFGIFAIAVFAVVGATIGAAAARDRRGIKRVNGRENWSAK